MWKVTGSYYYDDEVYFILENIHDDEFIIEVGKVEFEVMEELELISWLE